MKPLKIVKNKMLPFKGFGSMTFFNLLLTRQDQVSQQTINHENTHLAQAFDFHLWYFGFILFYIWYVVEWLLKLPFALFGYRAYYSISFEQAAYRNQSNNNYLKERKHFDWLKYLFKMIKK